MRENFIKWMKENYSENYTRSVTYYLDKYFRRKIRNQMEILEILKSAEKGKRHLCLGIRVLLNFHEAFNLMSEESLAKYRKVVKIPRTKSDDYVPEDEKVIEAFRRIEDERYQLVFKLLAFSGIRAIEAVYLLNNFNKEKVIIGEKIAKYPLSLERRTKKAFYAYMPEKFATELRRLDISWDAVLRYFRKRGLPAKYLRKWNYNFLILNGVPESVADFIQGRSSITVGAMHYLAKAKQADEWYSKVAERFAEMFSKKNAS